MSNELRTSKVCTKCKRDLALASFTRNTASPDGLTTSCRSCRKLAAAARYEANREQYNKWSRDYYLANREAALARQRKRREEKPEEIATYHRNWRLQNAYGLTLADFKAMEALQDGVCYVCKDPELRHAALVVDHCHGSGAVRKLLCSRCNSALGFALDDPARLRALADYLEAHHQ